MQVATENVAQRPPSGNKALLILLKMKPVGSIDLVRTKAQGQLGNLGRRQFIQRGVPNMDGSRIERLIVGGGVSKQRRYQS